MVSEDMEVQEEHGTIGSYTSPLRSDKISMDMGISNFRGTLLKDQLSGDDLPIKVRKPYTITKQRERWTDDEHNKFLEALKLYGRAWRKIEGHVGTKTAVQIRSHAQKFFSKVVRESNTGASSSEKPIEIPPPRPKRKPSHPYPRKLVSPVSNVFSALEKPMRTLSPNFAVLEQENQSPMSVLSAVGLDGSDSGTHNADGSPSPMSSGPDLNSGSEVPNGSSEEAYRERNLSLDEKITLRWEPCSQPISIVKQESSPSQCLKLFGKTLLVRDDYEQSHNPDLGKLEIYTSEERCLLPWTAVPLKLPACSLSGRPLYSGRMGGISRSHKDSLAPVPLTWLSLYGGGGTPHLLSPTQIKAKPKQDRKEHIDNDEKEGSSSGSSSNCESNSSSPFLVGNKVGKRISAETFNSKKGFVPYKRCLAKQDSVVSSIEKGDEREKQRIRLCL